jgi:hypothetical protein
MSETAMLVLAALGLAAWGLLMSQLAARLGLDRFGWGIVGAALGPLALVPFIGELRATRRAGTSKPRPRGRSA